MNIRKDFESVAPFLHRLAGIGDVFAKYNLENWPHLRHNEDFRKIYTFSTLYSWQFDALYAKGRDFAIFAAGCLKDFNDVGQFPTLSLYVDSFENTWGYRDELKNFLDETKELASFEETPWAVSRMIVIFDHQLRLMEAVRGTVEILKNTHLYKIEKGEAGVEKEQNISIGNINGKVNINSIDSSTNIKIDSSPIFLSLRKAIADSDIKNATKNQLLESIESMEKANGSWAFSEKYKDFIQQSANHMAIIAPFIPALTSLLGV